jgi:hypothetical protein
MSSTGQIVAVAVSANVLIVAQKSLAKPAGLAAVIVANLSLPAVEVAAFVPDPATNRPNSGHLVVSQP